MDSPLYKELIFQHFPSNVEMIPALTAKKSNSVELAEMADSVMQAGYSLETNFREGKPMFPKLGGVGVVWS